MKITPLGAAGGQVTGSCYVVETSNARVLIDCGLFQGGRKSEALNRPPTGAKSKIDAVLLTHAHLDHTGRLPILARMGYTGPVVATPATIDMTALILRDSARIQVADNERQNRNRMREGKPPQEPLYSPEDADAIIGCLRPVHYQQELTVAPGIQAIWAESGHMLGSASIQLIVQEDGHTRRIVFSGDLGPRSALILRDYDPFREADMVFLESTYGGRDHRPLPDTISEFVEIVQQSVESGAKILVPTFAVGRAQLILLLLSWMFRTGKSRPIPIFLDSPMAIQATDIYAKHESLFDDELQQYIKERPVYADLKTLRTTVSVDESKAINDVQGACVVLAGAGMCTAGRILHHFRANLWKSNTHVIIVGYQGDGSLGRQLVDGRESVRIFGDPIAVKAKIHTLGGFSGHAGQTDLMEWFKVIAPSRPRVVLTHGEDKQREALAALIHERYQLPSISPAMRETIEL
jgi:metallo-beta-lactamase family protein